MRIVSRKARKLEPNRDHTTYYNSKGEVVPSVTTVLKVLAKDGLTNWANNLGWRRISVTKELKDASDIGTMAHNYIEAVLMEDELTRQDLRREIDWMPDKLRDQTLNSIWSFEDWWKENKEDFKIIACEEEMSCEEYGGTLDIRAKYKGKPVILDIKTSKSFYFTMFLQLAAYSHIYKMKYGKYPKDVGVIRVDKTHGQKARLLWLSDLPNGDLDFYYISYKRILELYRTIHVLESDWKSVK